MKNLRPVPLCDHNAFHKKGRCTLPSCIIALRNGRKPRSIAKLAIELLDEIFQRGGKVTERQIGIAVRAVGRVLLLALLVAGATGCDRIRHITGLDREDATPGPDIPTATSIIRQLPADGNIVFGQSHLDGTPATIRAFVKNADWLTASPGAWYEIDVRYDVDASHAGEYVVVDVIFQTARVYNQPTASPRAIMVNSIPPGAQDPGRPWE